MRWPWFEGRHLETEDAVELSIVVRVHKEEAGKKGIEHIIHYHRGEKPREDLGQIRPASAA